MKAYRSVFLIVATAALTLYLHSTFAAGPNRNKLVILGKNLFADQNLSLYQNQSCKSCHHPKAGFADVSNLRNPTKNVVSTGSDGVSIGGRNAPTAAYAGFSPNLHQDADGTWIGGLFWDGRATGNFDTATGDLGAGPTFDPLADQAKGPFLNPLEMALTDEAAVAAVVANPDSVYPSLFNQAFPGQVDFTDVATTYNQVAVAIAAYERSSDLIQFGSRFDAFWDACVALGIDVGDIGVGTPLEDVPSGILTPVELQGLALFNRPNDNDGVLVAGEGGNCSACHPSGASEYEPTGGRALFTDFTYDNIGLPFNPLLEQVWGADRDLGLGDIVNDPSLYGAFKVPTLRNIAFTPPYGHNGVFATVEEIVDFYNTRMIDQASVCGDPGYRWDCPEIGDNVNVDELGNLGLAADDADKIVAFLLTLTDEAQ